MASEEYEKLKDSLKKKPTEEARKEAAEAFRKYNKASLSKRSKPFIVSLGKGKPYPHQVPLDQVPDEIERNPEFYELMKKVVEKG